MKFIPDVLWNKVKNIFETKTTKVGRPEFDNRIALEGILYVLYTGCQWKFLPKEYGCHTTVHGKFMKWCRLKVFGRLMEKIRELYCEQNPDNNWYALDSISKKAPFAKFGGKSPTDRGKKGVKETVLVDRKGAPLFLHVAPANVHDSKLLDPIIQQLNDSSEVRIIAADSAYDAKKLYSLCKDKNIALIASINPRRKKDVHVFHVPYRWIIEQTFGILSWFRGIKFCWSKLIETRVALLQLACSYRLFNMT